MLSDGACVVPSGNSCHSSLWAMYIHIVNAVLGGLCSARSLVVEHSVSSSAESEETLVTVLNYSQLKQLRP